MKPVCVIAEAGVNHNGDMVLARQLIDSAASCGADFVKFQSFRAAHLVTQDAPKAQYQKRTTGIQQNQYEMLKELELSEDQHFMLQAHCKKRNIGFLSSPFDIESAIFLVKTLGLTTLKIPSGELTNGPFLYELGCLKASLIISTGMSTLDEIEGALKLILLAQDQLNPTSELFDTPYNINRGAQLLASRITLLHCTTEYPAPFSEINLEAMSTMTQAFQLPVGYSDHTTGISISLAAAALGASVIEKHFTLDKTLPGPDQQASIEPHELKALVAGIREIQQAVGNGNKTPSPSEIKNRDIARKSLVASRFIKKGEVFSRDNIEAKRPGTGLSPMRYWTILGTKANRNFEKDELI
ncbi:MAG: N-acetylneuraminate synthase [Bdellovibrionales bacterium]|nr:N-acetylneuraminate synthase [Bdellovibrionales bacterium]